jgi:hypothetical protein
MCDKARQSCWLFHKWGKWHQYVQPMVQYHAYLFEGGQQFIENRQNRQCERCGKVQDERYG